MAITRRRFLIAMGRSFAGAASAAGLGHLGRMSALAQATGDYRALVCVFLEGGNDGNNLIVPWDAQRYDSYAAVRGPLALSKDSLLPAATGAGQVYGFHGALGGLHGLFVRRKLAVVANVGNLVRPITRAQYLGGNAPVPSSLFSHSDQQLQWQTAVPRGSRRTGWAGRAADRVRILNGSSQFPPAVSVAGVSVLCTGEETLPATITPGVRPGIQGFPDESGYGAAAYQALQELLTLGSGATLIQAASATTSDGLRLANLLNSAMDSKGPIRTPFPQTSLGEQLLEVAKVIQVRAELGVKRQVFSCVHEGFDTHAGQLVLHEQVLGELSEALTAFHTAMLELGVEDKVTAFTESEFGRTLEPSTGGGSDHGWGSHQLVMGGAVRGGEVLGRFPLLVRGGDDDAGDRGVWIPTTSMSQYGATLAAWFGVELAELPAVFPNIGNFPGGLLGLFAG